eukprot:TRINITY_DN3592_c0_g1_i1.p2 TRINITY_DN3592_c0_g1~~TRINITY_DN3592_c0_g1_i1.p2  ORF type:complete len:320 (+),score=174.89 TRINITY_DN3592_c0_g1_i1:56-1015(+)
MARLDDMDPRWLVEERADGANVNAWHWSEKDVTNEAKRLLKKYITLRPMYDEGDLQLRLLDLRGEIEGEATALNRRGKQGVFFDFDVKVEWHGEIKDRYGYESSDADGLIVFNVDQQTMGDFYAEVELGSLKMKGTDALVRAVKEKGVPALRNLIARFFEELRSKYDPTLALERAKERKAAAAATAEAEAAADLKRLEEEEGEFLREKEAAAAAEAERAAAAAAKAEEQQRRAAEAARRKEEERQKKAAIDAEIAAAAKAKKEAAAKEEDAAEEKKKAAVAAAEQAAADSSPKPTRVTNPKKTKKVSRDEELLAFICGD